MFSDSKLKLPFKVETIRFFGLEKSFSEVYYPGTASVSGFRCEEFRVTHFHSFNVLKISSSQDMGLRSKHMII